MQNMKHKFTFIVSLGIALILTAVIGATVSLHHCMKWDTYCDDGTLPLSAVKFTQNLIFHAYYWMGIAFICLCLVVAMLIWYFHHQQKLHPELGDMIADTSECEFKNPGEPLYQRNHHRRHDPSKPPPSGDLTGLSP